jgi:ABC-2 type transport system permease protein
MFSLKRIKAILMQEFFVTIRSFEVIMDIVVFPAMSIVVFGFLSVFIVGSATSFIGHTLIMGMLLWQVIFIIQYSVSVGSLWNIWSHNLSNMFVTPVSVGEYLIAYAISGILKSFIIFSISGFLLNYAFHFNILSLGIGNLILYYINLILFSFSFGIIILALIFRYGTKIQAFAWGLLPILQPLAAALYPVSVLPKAIQYISKLVPLTYVFESARMSLKTHSMNAEYVVIAFVLNSIYFIASLVFFHILFKQAKDSGQFARNDG